MNWPQVFPRFHLSQLKWRPLPLGARGFILRGFPLHKSTLSSRSPTVDIFRYAGRIFFFQAYFLFREESGRDGIVPGDCWEVAQESALPQGLGRFGGDCGVSLRSTFQAPSRFSRHESHGFTLSYDSSPL